VSGPIEKHIRLSRRANAVETSILSGQKAVAAAIAYNDSRLARIDSPPLWELWQDPESAVSALESVKVGMAAETRFLDQYNAATSTVHQWRMWLSVALLPLLLWLSVRSRRMVSDDPEIQASTRVLRRPFSSWIVVTMMGLMLLEPDAPMLLHQVALLIALVPVLRLLPAAVYAAIGPWPYIATGLYLLQRLSYLFLGNSYHYRIYLLALALLTAVLVAWLMWQRRPRAANRFGSRAGRYASSAERRSSRCSCPRSPTCSATSRCRDAHRRYPRQRLRGPRAVRGRDRARLVIRLLLARQSISRFRVVTQHAGALLHSVSRLLRLGAVVAWVVIVLNEFRVFRPIRDAVAGILTRELKFGEISITLGGVLLFFFSVWLALWVARTVRFILEDEVLPKMSLPRGVGNSISSLTYYAMVIFGLFVALAAAGFEVSQIAFVIGALGVGIGLACRTSSTTSSRA